MKKPLGVFVGSLAAAIMLSVPITHAEEASTLTRAQWLKKIGPSASNYDTLKSTVAQVASEDKAYFSQRLIKAVSRMAVNQAEKSAAFVRAAVGLIAGGKGDEKYAIMAEIFAGVPVEYLPAVTDALAKRFNQQTNKLTDESYMKIADKAIDTCVKRNAQTDDPAVRDTFVALCFIKASAKASDVDTGKSIIAKLPDGRIEDLAGKWVPKALDGDYADMLAAADVKPLAISKALGGRSNAVGSQTVLSLLADLNMIQNVNDAGKKLTIGDVLANGTDHDEFTQSGAIFNPHATEAGLSRRPVKGEIEDDSHRPLPYQNQRTGI